MAVDSSAVARVLGIATEFKDLRGDSILYLPQRIAVIAQGSSDAVFSTTKFTATSAAQVGGIAGYGSPAHLILRQLLPVNGDGVGTIPVDVFLLADHASGVAAAGSITPSGTQTKSASYRVLVNNIPSQLFVIKAGATLAAKLWAIYQAIVGVLEMPVKPAITYGTTTASALTGTGNGTISALSRTDTIKPGIYRLTVNTAVSNGGVWTLTDPDGVVLATNITMTPGAGGATVITSNGLQFTLTDGTTDFGLGAYFDITVAATVVTLTSKWKGTSANGLRISMEGEDLGTTFTLVQPSGGLANPTVDAALAQFGNVWETLVVNALEIDDTTALDTYASVGEGRWGQLVRKPFVAFTGNTQTAVASATTVSSARRTDRINAQIPSPGAASLPFVVAARAVARIAKVANNNPPTDYGSQRLTGLTPGADGVQWDYLARDQAVKTGSSTVEVKDGVVCLSDVITFYRPTGEEPPAYRYVVDIIKVMNILFNIDLAFSTTAWNGAPLIPDLEPTKNENARKPKHAKAELAAITDSLGDAAIVADRKAAKASIIAVIDSQNPKRLNVSETFKIVGNTNIISVTLYWGFYFGTQQAA